MPSTASLDGSNGQSAANSTRSTPTSVRYGSFRLFFEHLVKRARFRRRTTPDAELQNPQGQYVAAYWQRQHIPNAHAAARFFYPLAVETDAPRFRFFLGNGARLAKPCVEQPLVDAK